jgi:amino acid adenylation domain-containing protein
MSMAQSSVRLSEVDYDPFAAPELARAVPTTDAQRELWLADQLGREASLAFNESVTLELQGELRLQSLQDALLALADRHESLRSTFSKDGASMLISPRGSLQADLLDLTAQPAAAQAEALTRVKRAAVTTPFDLAVGPLVRATLVRLAPTRHELVLTVHHIVCDGWSFGVIARELMALYDAIAAGRPAALPPADSFHDYVMGAREPERARAAEADERYWVSLFDGSVPVLGLPTDRPRRPVRQFASRREDLSLEPALVEATRKLGARSGASLFATMFSVFAGLMGRLGGDSDVVIGVPSAGQAVTGMNNLVGHCVNLLPVRVLADPAVPVHALLRHGRERVLDAYDHPHCTFGRLLSRLQIGRDAGRLPLVSVQFNLDTAIAASELSRPGLEANLASNSREFEIFDLFVNASQANGAVVLECQYNTGLFDALTVRRWLDLYKVAIERAVSDAEQPVAALFAATVGDAEAVARWNATAAAYPRDARVEHLVTAQAGRSPQAVAVIDVEGTLTYLELEQRANALAAALHARAVGPGQLVGLACGRNRHLLVGMLGILKSGAGYVPLDPAFPADRLAHMSTDANLQCLVTDASVTPDAGTAAASGLLRFRLEELAPATQAPPLQWDTSAPAYVIYTSGSTGKPKGVVVPQRAVVNFLVSMARTPGLTADDRLVAVTTPSFDIAVLELLLPLTVGAQVVVATRDTVMDGPALRHLLEHHEATAMQATPSGWRLLVDAGWQGGPAFKALVGGEPLPQDLARQLLERTGQLWNMYGPTETTVWSTCWRVRHGVPVSIGTPIANTSIEVLDEVLRPCPVGVPGEIFIGGDGVTTGYLNRPELTAERFAADPFRPGQRLYRTGDRGRWRNEGVLEHLGRLDTQVKVRGYRIELGEIEANLVSQPAVERAVVVTREDTPGDVRIVAYVVCSEGALEASAVREHLRRSLPEYMMPAHFVRLQAVPLLPNGKVNRKALPQPEVESSPGDRRAAARNPVEALVLQTMEDVLHLPGLGIHDDLFAMGGHSLLAAKLTARLNKEFGISMPLRAVFEAPTAERLAAVVAGHRQNGAPRRPPIERRTGATTAPLTVMQERIRFMEQMQPGRVVYNTPSAHRLRGPFDRASFEAAFRRIVQRHASLRTVVQEGLDGPLQRVLERVEFELPLVDLGGLSPQERENELMRQLEALIAQPIAIDATPLFRVALFRLAPEEHVFLFMPHHIIWDGWSFDLLYQEMSALLTAAHEGREPLLAPLPVSYGDYAAWHAQWMQGDECRAQVAYWKTRFAAIEAPRALPTDRPRRAGMTGTGAVEWVHVDNGLTERLRRVAVEHGVTLNMLIMGMYAAMLSQALDSRSLVLGVPVRGRLGGDVESVMGFFNNLLPVHLAVRSEMPLSAWMGEVKRELLDSFANQDVPFERLAQEPEIAAHMGKAGLYQSLFSFQDARERERRWGLLSQSSVLVMQKGTTEDFGLWLMEVPTGLEGGINYNADLFDHSTAELFRVRLIGLLERVVAKPAAALRDLLAEPGAGGEAFVHWISAERRWPAASFAAKGTSDMEKRESTSAVLADAQMPRTSALDASQLQLAHIWSDLLGVPVAQVRASDNFFDLGGSSLLVMRATEMARSQLHLGIEPRRFISESLAQLAATPADPAAALATAHAAGRIEMAKPSLLSRIFGRRERGV